MGGKILIIEDDETFRSFLETILSDEGYEVVTVDDGLEGLQVLLREAFDLVVSDLKLPGKSGLELFRETRRETCPPPFIFLTAFGTVDDAVAAMKDGAVDFLTKPLENPDMLLSLVRRTMADLERSRAYLSLKEAETAGLPPEELIFAGEVMQEVRKLVHLVAVTEANVLICGESGTGKELVARTIHLLSPRGQAGFIALNCAAVPESLLESELFGHEKGAFTGAVQSRQGKFELARGGTIFLDEIGEMPLPLQAKLLRVLQERTFERVGGSREIKADVRIIAASNRNLQSEVTERRFREDLYYRLNVFPVLLPPLRDRVDIIPELADYFLGRFSRQIGKKLKGIDTEAMVALRRYVWPGNVRELQNIMERAVILARGSVCRADLPDGIPGIPGPDQRDSREVLKSVEREMIVKALERHNGNRRLAAAEMGISRRSLQYKLKEHNLPDNPA
jgi:two-component system, NtrC family, response regulator AtoC